MNRKQAIDYLTPIMESASMQTYKEALGLAIDALKAQDNCGGLAKLETQVSNKPLTLEQLQNMVGKWVWVVVKYEHCKCDGWAFVPTLGHIAYLDQTIPMDSYRSKFTAYACPPEATLEEQDNHGKSQVPGEDPDAYLVRELY